MVVVEDDIFPEQCTVERVVWLETKTGVLRDIRGDFFFAGEEGGTYEKGSKGGRLEDSWRFWERE